MVGNDQTGWRYFSFEGYEGLVPPKPKLPPLQEATFKTLAEAQDDERLKGYNAYIRWKTKPIDDQQRIKVAEELRNQPSSMTGWDAFFYLLDTYKQPAKSGNAFQPAYHNCQQVALGIVVAATDDETLLLSLRGKPPETYDALAKAVQQNGKAEVGIWRADVPAQEGLGVTPQRKARISVDPKRRPGNIREIFPETKCPLTGAVAWENILVTGK